MTLSELLNSDVETLVQWIRAGFAWWFGELAGLAPRQVREAFESRPSLTAEPLVDGGYRLTRHGRTVMQSVGSARRSRPVTLRLAPGAALIREVAAPPLPERDLRRMLELDIDRLTPFRSDQVFVAVVLGAAGSRVARVAAVPRETAILAVQQALAAGLEPRALGVAGAEAAEQAFDFLPRMRGDGAVPRPRFSPALIWGAVGALALANLGVAVGRDMLQIHGLQEQMDAQRPQVDDAQALRRKVLSENRRRADILARRAGGEPLRMLDAVTVAMPAGAWVDRLAWDGKSVRIAGYRQEQIDVAAALRAARPFSNVRNSGADVLTRQATGHPFDVTADMARPAGG
jgi:general secretion pathway protein L